MTDEFRAEAFRTEVRDWLAAHVPAEPLPSLDTADGFACHREWERELAAARLAVVSWPAAYGGRDATLAEWLVFEEEYYAAGAPTRVGQNGLSLLAPTLFAHGTADQRDRFLPRMATAEEVWAQTWPRFDRGACVLRGAGWSPAPRRGARGRRSRTGRSACSAPILTQNPRNGIAG
jgi:alkylation response protein AidB-like acyl-CoA dehydrogenase